MPDSIKKAAILIETLSVYKALEGLIHNINTPLNVIIGYTQQLKKQYPEINSLDKIYEAGLSIDDMIRSGSDSFLNRMDLNYSVFDLSKWLQDELKLLKNILEIKHSYRFELKIPDEKTPVHSNPLVLGLFFDSIIIFLKNRTRLATENRLVSLGVDQQGKQISLNIRLPEYTSPDTGIKEYLTELRNELECSYTKIFAEGNPFSWDAVSENEIKLLIPIES